jgi:hypothetical protein
MKAAAGIQGGDVRVPPMARFVCMCGSMTQEQMSQLFGRERSVITKHARNVFRERELEPGPTCAKFAQVRTEGDRTVTRNVDPYNAMSFISVSYRVKSVQGTHFRQWLPPRISLPINMACLS